MQRRRPSHPPSTSQTLIHDAIQPWTVLCKRGSLLRKSMARQLSSLRKGDSFVWMMEDGSCWMATFHGDGLGRIILPVPSRMSFSMVLRLNRRVLEVIKSWFYNLWIHNIWYWCMEHRWFYNKLVPRCPMLHYSMHSYPMLSYPVHVTFYYISITILIHEKVLCVKYVNLYDRDDVMKYFRKSKS